MNEHLERLLACDEEGRARLERERVRAREALESLEHGLEEERRRRLRDLEVALESELAGIRAGAERAVAERRRRRDEFRAERSRIAAAALPRAIEAFVRIVRDGPDRERS
jgi:predicted  nucleic acid-binding Zn-ribbon protein